MAFSEALKKEVRRKSHHRCCICHVWDVEIHHIIPQEDGGPDDEDNAAPLCGTCHNQFGANPEKRKAIRETRDLWYELCVKRFASDEEQLRDIRAAMSDIKATSEEMLATVREVKSFQERRAGLSASEKAELDRLVSVMFNARVDAEYTGRQYAEWLQELDPNDARWVLLAAKHDIQLLRTLSVMRTAGIAVLQSEDKEVTAHAADINVEKLEEVFWRFVEICQIPTELVGDLRDDLRHLREERGRDDDILASIKRAFTFRSCTIRSDARGVTFTNRTGVPVVVRSVELLAKTKENYPLSLEFYADSSRSAKGTQIDERGWVSLPIDTAAFWAAPTGEHIRKIGKFGITGAKVVIECQWAAGGPRLIGIESEERDVAAVRSLFQDYYDRLVG